MPKASFLDHKDRQLLMLMQQNSRFTNQEIGSKLKLSTSAVNDRIRKLVGEKVITGVHAHVDPKKVGLQIGALISVSIDIPANTDKFLKRMCGLPEIQECHHVTGEYSYLLKVRVKDTDHLEKFITHGVKAAAGVTKTKTTIILSSPINRTLVDCLGEEVTG